MSSVMLVDDEPLIRELYAQMLAVGGYDVVATANDGEEAVDRFEHTLPPPDVILMDHRMPGKNGLTATREITDAHPGTKVLMVTADFTIQPRVATEGARGLLEKPFTMDQLFAAIEQVLAA